MTSNIFGIGRVRYSSLLSIGSSKSRVNLFYFVVEGLCCSDTFLVLQNLGCVLLFHESKLVSFFIKGRSCPLFFGCLDIISRVVLQRLMVESIVLCLHDVEDGCELVKILLA